MEDIVRQTKPWDESIMKLSEERFRFERKVPWSAACKQVLFSAGKYWSLATYADLVEIEKFFTVNQNLYRYVFEKTPLETVVKTHHFKYIEELAWKIPYGLYRKVTDTVTVDDMDYIRYFGWIRWCCKKLMITNDFHLIGEINEIPVKYEYIKKDEVKRLLSISSTSLIDVVNQIEYEDYETVLCDEKSIACMRVGPVSGQESSWYLQHRDYIDRFGWFEWCAYILAKEYDIFMSQADTNFFIEAPSRLLSRG